jgi:hypothetical protein
MSSSRKFLDYNMNFDFQDLAFHYTESRDPRAFRLS